MLSYPIFLIFAKVLRGGSEETIQLFELLAGSSCYVRTDAELYDPLCLIRWECSKQDSLDSGKERHLISSCLKIIMQSFRPASGSYVCEYD